MKINYKDQWATTSVASLLDAVYVCAETKESMR
jgi:hypothetical protein